MNEPVISQREQLLRNLYAEASSRGLSTISREKARGLLVELEAAQTSKTLSGYEASKLPWLRNIAK